MAPNMTQTDTSPTLQEFDLVHTCRKCSRICVNKGEWVEPHELKIKLDDSSLSHGMCPSCIREENPEMNTQMFRKVDGEMTIIDATDLVHS